MAKKGDKFFLSKNNCKTFKVYIFGKDRKFFHNKLKKYMIAQSFKKLEPLLRKVFLDIKNEKNDEDQIILFSPAAASFDNFKNFEERGKYFNNTVKKLINAN